MRLFKHSEAQGFAARNSESVAGICTFKSSAGNFDGQPGWKMLFYNMSTGVSSVGTGCKDKFTPKFCKWQFNIDPYISVIRERHYYGLTVKCPPQALVLIIWFLAGGIIFKGNRNLEA